MGSSYSCSYPKSTLVRRPPAKPLPVEAQAEPEEPLIDNTAERGRSGNLAESVQGAQRAVPVQRHIRDVGPARIGEMRSVGHVECLAAKLNFETFLDGNDLQQAQI